VICQGAAPDRMTSAAFHEYAEAATNPHISNISNGDGWYTNEGLLGLGDMEVADLCNNATSTYQVWPNVYNDPVGGSTSGQGYAQPGTGNIQELYSNEVQGCTYWRGEDGFVPKGSAPHTVSAPMQALYDAYAWNGSVPSVPGWGYPTSDQVPISGGLLQ